MMLRISELEPKRQNTQIPNGAVLSSSLLEPKFKLTDGFVTVICRKPDSAFKAVGGETTEQIVGAEGIKLALSRHQV